MIQAKASRSSGNSQSRSTSGVSRHGSVANNKNHLKSDKNAGMAGNPAAQQDQFGSRHNADKMKQEQRRSGKPNGPSDSAFRESAQDTPPVHGAKNRIAGRRSKPKARKEAIKRGLGGRK